MTTFNINNKGLLYSTGNYIQHLVINYNGKQSQKECACVCARTYCCYLVTKLFLTL